MDWRIKAATQQALSVLPFGERVNHFLQRKVTKAFSRRNMLLYYRAQARHIVDLNSRFPLAGRTIVEIGPGWNSKAGVLFWLLGAKKIHWVDSRRVFNRRLLLKYADVLRANSKEVSETLALVEDDVKEKLASLVECRSDSECFGLCRITYDAPGDARAICIGDGEADLIYSYGVLEHIPWNVLGGGRASSKNRAAYYHLAGVTTTTLDSTTTFITRVSGTA